VGEGTSVSAVSSEGRLPARAFEVISGDPKLVEHRELCPRTSRISSRTPRRRRPDHGACCHHTVIQSPLR
jgi:hypothetical protein